MEYTHNGNSDSKFLQELKILANTNESEFAEKVINLIIAMEDDAVADPTPPETKIRALKALSEFFITEEKYEYCAKIVKLIERIENESK